MFIYFTLALSLYDKIMKYTECIDFAKDKKETEDANGPLMGEPSSSKEGVPLYGWKWLYTLETLFIYFTYFSSSLCADFKSSLVNRFGVIFTVLLIAE